MMDLNIKKVEYRYFDDPNELVDRLRLLIASQQAGNTGHNNEIISIIEELKEAKIIVKLNVFILFRHYSGNSHNDQYAGR